jgi:hypothetical protein
MTSKFRRVAVLGVTSLGTWAIVPVPAQAADQPAQPPAKVTTLSPRADTPVAPSELPGVT